MIHTKPQPSTPSRERIFNAADLAQQLHAELVGDASASATHLENFDEAGPSALTFIRSPGFARKWPQSSAALAIISRSCVADALPNGTAGHMRARALLVVADADLSLITLLASLEEPADEPHAGIHPTAIVDPGATLHAGVSVGPFCIVERGVILGEGAMLHSHVVIGRHTTVGKHTILHTGVRVLERCTIGNHCILHPGAVIGADGFGYRPNPSPQGFTDALIKVPHIGTVTIADHVEIGANTCVDRAKFGATIIGEGTKIDNLVQVAHNCVIGRACVICGKVGMAGSVTVGDGALIGGAVVIVDNIAIGKNSRIAAYSGVHTDVPENAEFMGMPAGPAAEWRRSYAILRRIGKRKKTRGVDLT